MNDLAPVREYMARHCASLRLWIGKDAWDTFGPRLAAAFEGRAELLRVPAEGSAAPGPGPAILLLTPVDLSGQDRGALLRLVTLASPGRPVVLGGSRDKDTLLEAINTWNAYRLLPGKSPVSSIVDTLTKAYEAMATEIAVERCADELREECRRLNGALEELHATQERLLHAERLTTVGRIMRRLMTQTKEHFRNIEAFRAARDAVADDVSLNGHMECALDGINSFGVLLDDMVALTEDRTETLSLQDEELDPLVERTVTLFRYDALGRIRDIRSTCGSGARVHLDRYRFYHVLLNLLRNAAQATRDNARISVRTRATPSEILVEVEDEGSGMTAEVQRHIFTPFFTTKGSAGMGLGLRLSKSIIEQHGGALTCRSEPGEGTCFTISLPLIKG